MNIFGKIVESFYTLIIFINFFLLKMAKKTKDYKTEPP